ncbi:hypothetical protein [Pseudorhizobium tarimense]|uniref:hypothetical protein n=1 Tax=Pseudorhizobium tarimense TaxID=1079109 RepID=UPI001FF61375|nr:hypothetical protein [Pseudorhizobium tarimense]MCJ8518341.1 hypothetical protein [Pseudorhizobium tarimense]
MNKLLTQAAPHIGKVAQIALWTMQRQADILTMPMLTFDGERVSIKQGKTGARVRVVAAPDIMPVLRDAKEKNRQRILVNSFGQNWTSSRFRASWGKEMARLYNKGVTFHDLRGTAITYAYANLGRSHAEKSSWYRRFQAIRRMMPNRSSASILWPARRSSTPSVAKRRRNKTVKMEKAVKQLERTAPKRLKWWVM